MAKMLNLNTTPSFLQFTVMVKKPSCQWWVECNQLKQRILLKNSTVIRLASMHTNWTTYWERETPDSFLSSY